MRKADLLFRFYGMSHKKLRNEWGHWVGVPVVFLSILGMFSLFPLRDFCIGEFFCVGYFNVIVTVLLTVFYWRLSKKIAMVMLVLILLSLFLVHQINQIAGDAAWGVYLVAFAVAWLGQVFGLQYEGRRPSLFKDLQFLLIGPAWLLHKTMRSGEK